MKNILRQTAAFIIFVSVMLASSNALALNADYLDYEKWKNNQNVTLTNLSETAYYREQEYHLSGTFGYYVDNASMCVYTYFALNEIPKTKDNCDIKVIYIFTSDSEDCTICIGSDGITPDSSPQAKNNKIYSVDFMNYAGSSRFTSAVQYKGKDSVLNIEIMLNVNDHIYRPNKFLKMEKPAKTKSQRSTRAENSKRRKSSKTTRKNKSEKSTKFVPKGKYSNSKSRQRYRGGARYTKRITKKEKQGTLYKPSGYSKNSSEIYREGESFDSSASSYGGETAKKMKLSEPAVLLTGLAILLAAAGMTILITTFSTKSTKKSKKSSDSDDEDWQDDDLEADDDNPDESDLEKDDSNKDLKNEKSGNNSKVKVKIKKKPSTKAGKKTNIKTNKK